MRKAKDIMTQDLTTIKEQMSLREAGQILSDKGVSGLPVVNEKERVIGFLSEHDIIAAYCPGNHGLASNGFVSLKHLEPVFKRLRHGRSGPVKDYMNSNIVTVKENSTLNDVAKLMIRRNFKRIPVLKSDGRLAGMIDRSALTSWLQVAQQKN